MDSWVWLGATEGLGAAPAFLGFDEAEADLVAIKINAGCYY